jgi:hypothetical protein
MPEPPHLTDLGATKAGWNSVHTVDPTKNGEAYFPQLPGGDGDHYAGVQTTGPQNRVYLYGMQYAPGESVAAVTADMAKDLPPDARSIGIVKAQCEWEFKYRSAALATVLGADDPDGSFTVTLSTLIDHYNAPSTDNLLIPSDITSVDVASFAGMALADITC